MSLYTDKPLVSIMIPYYNCKEYIAETLASINKQTYLNIEIIIVNDGSNDADGKFIELLVAQHNNENKNNIKLINQKNQGTAVARNTAASYATGQYFVFIDADDVVLPNYVEQCVAILESNQEIKLVYSRAEFFDKYIGIWELPRFESFHELLQGNHIPCVAMHRSIDFRAVGGFDTQLLTHEDWDLWIRILKDGGKAEQIPEVLFRYRKRDDQTSLTDKLVNTNLAIQESWQRVYVKHSDLFSQYGLGYFDLVCCYQKYRNYQNKWWRRLLTFLKKKS